MLWTHTLKGHCHSCAVKQMSLCNAVVTVYIYNSSDNYGQTKVSYGRGRVKGLLWQVYGKKRSRKKRQEKKTWIFFLAEKSIYFRWPDLVRGTPHIFCRNQNPDSLNLIAFISDKWMRLSSVSQDSAAVSSYTKYSDKRFLIKCYRWNICPLLIMCA